ncbi:hypothetical protein PR048_002509 [Dryococelus australis]|uniref:Uncharacterized protein n=1 Tax=Dryococelus australis TaxID=614101 RepID=A0ABQ9IKC7_9NEOP|nr:hypothetical protein PR048_002509 [Dryococelus australis]
MYGYSSIPMESPGASLDWGEASKLSTSFQPGAKVTYPSTVSWTSRSCDSLMAILLGTRFRKSSCKVCHSCRYTGLYGPRHGIFRLARPDFIPACIAPGIPDPVPGIAEACTRTNYGSRYRVISAVINTAPPGRALHLLQAGPAALRRRLLLPEAEALVIIVKHPTVTAGNRIRTERRCRGPVFAPWAVARRDCITSQSNGLVRKYPAVASFSLGPDIYIYEPATALGNHDKQNSVGLTRIRIYVLPNAGPACYCCLTSLGP